MLSLRRQMHGALATILQHDLGPFATNNARLLTTGTVDDIGNSKTKRDSRIRLFAMSNRASDALDLLHRSLFQTPVPDPVTGKVRYLKLPPASVCNKVLHSASTTKDPSTVLKAVDLADHLRLQGSVVTPRTQEVLVLALANTGQVERGLKFMDDWMAANIALLEDDNASHDAPHTMLSALLEAAAVDDDSDAILEVLGRMARVGLSPSRRTMVSLLQCFMRLGNVQVAYGMLQWMRRSGFDVDVYAYTALMTVPMHVRGGASAAPLLRKAKEAYAEMKEYEVPATAHFYSAYIALCARAQDLDAAQEAWNDMVQAGVSPTIATFNSMLSAFGKCRDPEGALKFYQGAGDLGLKLDSVAYGTLLSALHGQPEEASRIWKEVQASGVKPECSVALKYLDILLESSTNWQVVQDLLCSTGSSTLFKQALASAVERQDDHMLSSLLKLMNSHRVPHTVGTMTELLVWRSRSVEKQQKRQHLWILRTHEGSSRQLELSNTSVTDALVTGLAPTMDMHSELYENGKLSCDDALAIIGMLSIKGDVDRALELYTTVAPTMSHDSREWALNLLLYGAFNAPKDRCIDLILQVVKKAREWTQEGSNWWFEPRSQRAIARLLRRSPEAAGLDISGNEIRKKIEKILKRT